MKIPTKPAKAPSPKKSDEDREACKKQFDSHAMSLKKAFDDSDEITLPVYGDETSIDAFVDAMSAQANSAAFTTFCKENQIPLGKNKADRIKGILMHNVDDV